MRHIPLSIENRQVWLNGLLTHAPDVRGLAIIAHTGTDETQHIDQSYIIETLNQNHYATLSFNLLSTTELTHTPDMAYNIAELEQRILVLSEWGRHQPHMTRLHQSLIVSGTACAAGIRAASLSPSSFHAVICYGGRPDLAGRSPLNSMKVPVRFIVDQSDPHMAMLQQAFSLISGPHDWHLVPSSVTDPATTLRLTTEWLEQHPHPLSHPTSEINTETRSQNSNPRRTY